MMNYVTNNRTLTCNKFSLNLSKEVKSVLLYVIKRLYRTLQLFIKTCFKTLKTGFLSFMGDVVCSTQCYSVLNVRESSDGQRESLGISFLFVLFRKVVQKYFDRPYTVLKLFVKTLLPKREITMKRCPPPLTDESLCISIVSDFSYFLEVSY